MQELVQKKLNIVVYVKMKINALNVKKISIC